MSDVTRLLSRIEGGDPRATEELLPLVYDELRKLAAAKLVRERPGQTLQATALVHDAYIRLVDVETAQRWDSRGHCFAAAAEAMRRILVDTARRKRSRRRGGERRRFELEEGDLVSPPVVDDLLDLDEALTELDGLDEQSADVVKLRVFAGMTIEEVAVLRGVSPRTIQRAWAYGRAWLGRRLAARRDPRPE